MKLDINLVWHRASAAVAANREVLAGLAGVFILLPRIAFELFAPPAPEARAGMGFEAMATVLQSYYASIMPWLLAVVVVETTGTLALLTLLTDPSNPTVGQAIRRGALSVIPYLAAQMLFVLGLGIASSVVLGLAGMSGSKPLAGLVLGTILFWAVYAGMRLTVLAPVIVVDHARGPLAAIGRAWRLTRGNAARICALLALFVVVMVVALLAASGVVGSLGTMLAGRNAARIAVSVVTSIVSSSFTVYLVAIIAAIHLQLTEQTTGANGGLY